MFDLIIYNNINTSIPHDVGKNCAYHLIPFYQWFLEIIIVSIVIIFSLIYAFMNITLPKKIKYDNQERSGKQIILLLMAIFFGYEIGYKFSSDTLVHLLSLCHIATAIQLYILVAKPSRLVTALFRIQLNYLSGPVVTFLFPQSESRILLAHKSIYYLQHGMMFVIAIYLIRIGGVYSVGPLDDFSWNILAISVAVAYHYWLLLPIAFPMKINLNYMLCPAVVDPFGHETYRIAAIVHQGVFGALIAKIICLVCDFIFTQYSNTKIKDSLDAPLVSFKKKY